ncbi:MAG: sensor histidine kinase [Oscillospiraceae bacterium]
MKKKNFSIKYRVLVWVFALLLPLVLLLSANAILQVGKTYEQLETSEGTNLQLLVSQLEMETREVEEYLYDLALKNRVFRSMADRHSETQLYANAYEVLEASENLFQTKSDLSFLVLYSEKNEFYAARDNGLEDLELTERVRLQEAVRKRFLRYFLEGNSQHRQWFTVEIADRWFLCRAVYYQGMYCAGLFDLSSLADRLALQMEDDCLLVFRDEETLLTTFPEEAVPGGWSESTVRIGGRKYMLLGEELCGIELSYLFPYSGIIGSMGLSLSLVILIAIAVLIAIVVFYLQLKRDFFLPLDNLVNTMRKIRDGNTEMLSDETRTCEEFREVNRTFNQMLGQIRNLKIEQYEKELETQRAELSFLQAQIRPHFYLNCLKVVYALAQQEKYADIKTCVLLVSKHLRYALQVRNDTVPMREELSFCENYVKLCGIMSNVEPHLVLDVEALLLDLPIPPISLLSLVENSVRINLTPNKELQIRIRAKQIQTEDGPMLYLTVQDNGTGFTQEQLEWLNGDDWLRQTTTHVGLQNVVRRFRILYGDAFSVAFLNRDGATVELYLPIGGETEKGEHGAEAIDRG